jgi:hypothetical protein
MMDFFKDLVLRSSVSPAGSTEGKILQPRLPSLFEVPGGVPPLPAGIGVEDRRGESRTAVSPADEAGTRGRRSQSFSGPDLEARLRNPVAPDVSTGEDAVQPGANPQLNGSESRPARLQPERALGRADDLPGNSEDLLPASPPAMGDQARHMGPDRSGWVESAKPQNGPEVISILHPHLEFYQPAPGHTPPTSVGLAGLSNRKTADQALFDSSRDDLQPATVHIHIGRIEVRALTPAPGTPTRPPASPRPKLSLDEYLRQRNEGKR